MPRARATPLLALACLVLACATATPPDESIADERHVIPQGLVHVGFRDLDTAPLERIPLREALRLRDVVEHERLITSRDPNHRAWFFHAFDRRTLEFFVARWQPLRQGGTYTAERRILVRRSDHAARALAVDDTIAGYEQGRGDLRAGMSAADVERRRGLPQQVIQLGPVGAFDHVYPDLCVRFLSGRVAHLWPRAACLRN